MTKGVHNLKPTLKVPMKKELEYQESQKASCQNSPLMVKIPSFLTVF